MDSYTERKPSAELQYKVEIISNALADTRGMDQWDNVKNGIDKLEKQYYTLLKAIDVLKANDL
jgi:hypothetical protein